MEIHGPILAATALGSASDEALRQAHQLGEATRNSVIAVHVLPEFVGSRPLFPELHRLDHERVLRTEQVARAALREQWSRVLGTEATDANLHLSYGTPHSGVLLHAEEIGASLIVVGSGSRRAGISLGGVSERIVRHAHCPVLVALPPRPGPVIGATDFSDPALPAVRWAELEAARRHLKFAILHSVDLYVSQVASPEVNLPEVSLQLIEARRDDARERLAQVEAKCQPSGGVLLLEGPAEEAIAKAAEQLDADLVVVGTHGRTGFRRLALGSVAEGIVRRATCSVLVVRLAS